MREQKQLPLLHIFVCANRRDASSPLGPGCGDHGEEAYAALKDEVARRGAFASAWITKTHCLGVCPKSGCTIAMYDRARSLYSEVTPKDALALLSERMKPC